MLRSLLFTLKGVLVIEAYVQEAFVKYSGPIKHKINITLENTSSLVDYLVLVKDKCIGSR
jgi:hypothetical protein